MAIIIAFIGIVLLGSMVVCFKAFVLTKIWAWFIVPTFGLPMLTIPVAIGISCIFSLLVVVRNTNKDNEKDDWNKFLGGMGDVLLYGLVQPAIVLLIAWIAHLLM